MDSGVETGNESNDGTLICNSDSKVFGEMCNRGKIFGEVGYTQKECVIPSVNDINILQKNEKEPSHTGGGKMVQRRPNIARRYAIDRSCMPYLKEANLHKLHVAVTTNNVERVKELLSRGVSPNEIDKQGRSPLHLASCRGYAEIVKILLAEGANPNLRDCIGNTPLHLAVVTSNVSVVTLLLKAGTNVLSADIHGNNPMQLAATKLRLLKIYRGSKLGLFEDIDFEKIRTEVSNVVEMLIHYLIIQENAKQEIDDLAKFCSSLSISNDCDENQVNNNIDDLLSKIDTLNIKSQQNKSSKTETVGSEEG